MELRPINDFIQILVSIGVIISLIFVLNEVREANWIALGESIREISGNLRKLVTMQYTTDVHDIFIRSFENPDQLSRWEILKLESYLTAVISNYEDWWRMNDLGLAEYDGTGDPREDVDY